MSSVFSGQGNGVNSIFVTNKSLSVPALGLETKNSTDSFFPFSPSPIPTLMRSVLAFAGAGDTGGDVGLCHGSLSVDKTRWNSKEWAQNGEF